MNKGKLALKIAAAVLALAVFGAGGYYIGKNSKSDISAAIPREETQSPPPAETPAPEKKPERPVTYVTRSDVSAAAEGAWSVVGTYEADMTGDGQADTLTVYTSAESADGEIMWDDGQNWVAEVYDNNGGYYALLSRYVNNGCVYAEVEENESREKTITLIVTGGAGLSVKRYAFTSSGFEEQTALEDANANVVFSTVPFYR